MRITAPRMTLAELFEELDRHDHRLPLDVLEARMKLLEIEPSQIEPFVRFAPDTYRRNLLRAGPAYHALILCWKPGQRSPIHDHSGSSCGVRVIRGVCTETIFQRTNAGHIYPTETRHLSAGYCCASQDADIHQISNLESNQELVTMHIYSPPLLVMGQYSLTSPTRSEFVEPDLFVGGAGI